jgi:ABC-type branched-subunit amino acid transport system substrate-binding protein
MGREVPSIARDFFCGYLRAFDDPNNKEEGSPYGYSRQDTHVMLAYDASETIFQAFSSLKQEKLSSREAMQEAIQRFDLCHPHQGVTGQIALDSMGNPLLKSILILKVRDDGTAYIFTDDVFKTNPIQGQQRVPEKSTC